MPTQLNVVTQNASGTVTTSTITVPISAALQALDSAASGGSGVASGQTGHSSVDEAIRNIFRAGVFTDGQGNWYPVINIQKITFT
jgi:hypothetical protein